MSATEILTLGAAVALLGLAVWSLRRGRAAQAALREREQWLVSTMRCIPDGMITTDAAGRVTLLNETAETITGWREAEARGRPAAEIFRLLRRETREPVESLIDVVLRQGQKISAPDPRLLIAKNGLEHFVTATVAPVRDAAGGLAGLTLVFHDVTQRELGESALLASQEMFRVISEHVSDFIAVLDLQGRRLYSSRSYARHFPHKELYLSPSLDEVHPDDLEKARALLAEMVRTGRAQRGQFRLVRPDGGILHVETEGNVIAGAGGRAEKILVVSRDITARKAAEDALRATMKRLEKQYSMLAAHARSPAVREGRTDQVMPALAQVAAETLGVARTGIWFYDEARTHLRCAHLHATGSAPGPAGLEIAAADYPAYFAALAEDRAIAAGDAATDPRTHELAAVYLPRFGITSLLDAPIRSEGRTVGVVCHEHTGPARQWQPDEENFAGSMADLVALSLEVARRKEAQEALREAHASLEVKVAERTRELAAANERLKELDRLKSEFLATMSHELRTPLNSIIGFTGILRQGLAGPVNDEQGRQLGMVLSSARHLLGLINDLLDLSRIESGRMEVVIEEFPIAEVVREVVESLGPMAAQKNLLLETAIATPAPVLRSDRKKCFQILLNLANNAVKFTPSGRVVIAVRAADAGVEIAVTDTGIGIKPESMVQLFQAFRQVDGSARRAYEGTGLGLYLCRELATLLGGGIAVESEFGKGSRFVLSLPNEPPATAPR